MIAATKTKNIKTLAIFSPSHNAYSETFIQAHKKLPFSIKYYYDGFLPSYLEGKGKVINYSKLNRIRNRFNKNFTLAEQGLINSLREEKVDCILAEYGHAACVSLKVSKHLKLPLIVHFHGLDATLKSIISEYANQYKLLFNYAKYVVVVSEKMKHDLMRLGCPDNKLILTYCGPNDSFYNAAPTFRLPHFISVGRFVDKKAPYLTIAAFKEVVNKYPDAKLVMIGNGELLNTCKNLTKLWRIEKNVDFGGIKTPSEIVELFEQSLAFVQHSIIADNGDSEGTPVGVLEAQAAGLPVISTFHAGIADVVVDNETGLLVQEYDVEGMSKNMLRVLQEKGLANKLGEAGRIRTKENFSMHIHLKTLEKAINDAAN